MLNIVDIQERGSKVALILSCGHEYIVDVGVCNRAGSDLELIRQAEVCRLCELETCDVD